MGIARIYHSLRKAPVLGLLVAPLVLSAFQAVPSVSEGNLSALSTQNAHLETQVVAQGTLISYLATRAPAQIDRQVDTVEPTPYQPVQGFVEIEDGACCVGGKAGDSLDIGTTFQASSPLGAVTQMRVRFGSRPFVEEELSESEWEPFELRKAFTIEIANNWVGYHVSVQYMDENGNISPVYNDDIAVEGHP